jgi:N6-adenosine-specific RNA methylase IME4
VQAEGLDPATPLVMRHSGSAHDALRSTIGAALAPAREHSHKPDETYARIEALLDGPYLELFSHEASVRIGRAGATRSGSLLRGARDSP